MEERVYNPKIYLDEELKNKSGIYQIRNLANGKLYIGSASNLYRRKKHQHLYLLRKRVHHNTHLQNAFNKYGEQNFIFEVIEFVEDKNKLLELEQYWLDKLNIIKEGYNKSPIADKPLSLKGELSHNYGRKPWNKGKSNIYSEETLNRMSKSAKNRTGDKNSFYGKHHSDKTKSKIGISNSVKIIRLKDLKIFNSNKECSEQCGLCTRQITQHCLNRLKTIPQRFMYYSDYIQLTPEQIQEKLNK